ncbi:MAG: hypothetical protein BalsKO_06700 [Balneolaceae bacterium]
MKIEEAYKDLFMICEEVKTEAYSKLPSDFHIRSCRKDELSFWKDMHFDRPEDAKKYRYTIDEYFENTYGGKEELFFVKCLMVCNKSDTPIATCFIWKSYNRINTVQWLKVNKKYENKGIGRALLTIILDKQDYPVYLSTQTRNFRAIKLYSDFGFKLLSNSFIGDRRNELKEALPILQKYMTPEAYQNLDVSKAPDDFIEFMQSITTKEF